MIQKFLEVCAVTLIGLTFGGSAMAEPITPGAKALIEQINADVDKLFPDAIVNCEAEGTLIDQRQRLEFACVYTAASGLATPFRVRYKASIYSGYEADFPVFTAFNIPTEALVQSFLTPHAEGLRNYYNSHSNYRGWFPVGSEYSFTDFNEQSGQSPARLGSQTYGLQYISTDGESVIFLDATYSYSKDPCEDSYKIRQVKIRFALAG